jgi:hypothetical protein
MLALVAAALCVVAGGGLAAPVVSSASEGQAIVNAPALQGGLPYCWDGGGAGGPTLGDANVEGATHCGGSTAPGSAFVPVGPNARLAPAGKVVHPGATQNPGTGMSTDFDWATLVLEDGGWPTSSNNVTVITQWMASENCIPTTSTCPYPWWNRNNPLNNGLGSGGGDGTGSYENLVIAAYYVALNLEASNYGYPQIAADLAASAAPSATATAIEDSDWAASHYGYGSGWHSSAVQSIAAPASAWGNGGREPNGSFIKVTGATAIYRVIGGAPVHVDNCAPLGGCLGLVEVPSLDGYATEPENGAFMRMANGPVAGLVARVVGGVPLGLTTCEGMESEGCNEAINLDEGGFNEYAAAHQVVANGTFVRVADGPKAGLIGRVVGGVLLGLVTCEGMEGEGCNSAVNVAENAYDYYASEYHTIANGTFVRLKNAPDRSTSPKTHSPTTSPNTRSQPTARSSRACRPAPTGQSTTGNAPQQPRTRKPSL